MQGAHTVGRNNDAIGIENEGLYTTETPPFRLWNSLVALCAYVCNQYGLGTDSIQGHRTYNGTECPGTNFFHLLGTLRDDIDTVRARGFLPPRGRWLISYPGSNEDNYYYVFMPDSQTVKWAHLTEPSNFRAEAPYTIQGSVLRIQWDDSHDEWYMPMDENSSGSTFYNDGSVSLVVARRQS